MTNVQQQKTNDVNPRMTVDAPESTSDLTHRLLAMPDQLSAELVERMEEDRVAGWINPYRAADDAAIRREPRAGDAGDGDHGLSVDELHQQGAGLRPLPE